MRQDDYIQYRDELLKQKSRPYIFSNEPLADDFFTALKKEYPDAAYYKGMGQQYICLTGSAEKKLLKMIRQYIEDTQKHLQALTSFEGDIVNGIQAQPKGDL